ncbi:MULTISPECIES: BTAD domain-containing putative transcriptional regulator [unclassified Amycolatopsis]|uniref:BTAD domain-containing putative transcriptional regulator n=1 Tax=unclassified Amycolatopsis TaxID=2618356 RepID=UPI0021037592|nr:BTAD domain-containing putative transcriptional regulator [Amycolatopsis sp. DSM 110486]
MRGLLATALLVALLAGLPLVLIYGVGWPLPDHVPSLDELEALLRTPMSSTFLLNALACVAWLLWTVFILDVAACAVDVVRGARRPQDSGPVRRVAAALVGTLLVALLGRTANAAPASTPSPGHLQSYATSAAAAVDRATAADTEATRPAQPAGPGAERVREPGNGVHDSLWRVAQRCLGDGDRWPEIWALNRGSTQPDGRILRNPNLLHPGDLLRLPAAEPTPSPVAPAQPAAPHHLAPTLPSPETGPSPQAVAPPASDAAPGPEIARTEHSGGAVTWGEGEVFIGLGLATAVSALLLLARRRRHARYQPGSGHRGDDLPAAPIVYRLRQAHLRAQRDNDLEVTDPADPGDDDIDPALDTRPPAEPHCGDNESVAGSELTGGQGSGAAQVLTTGARRVVGASAGAGPTRVPSAVDLAVAASGARTSGETGAAGFGGGMQIALDLAQVHGLGLVGPGAYAAARALLLTLLTAPAPAGDAAPEVLLPAADLTRVAGLPIPATSLPRAITVTTDLEAALTRLDTDPAELHRPRMLIATPPQEASRQARLQQLLDNHGTAGMTAVLLGQWRPGVTAYVTAAGIISATDPGPGESLRGTRAFTLPDTAARDLLSFLHAVQRRTATEPADPPPNTSPRAPAAPAMTPEPAEASNGLETTAGSHDSHSPTSPASPSSPVPPTIPDATVSDASIELTVFGAPTLRWRTGTEHPEATTDLTSALSARLLELVVFLAVHPAGVARDAIVDALWPDDPPRNPASVLRTVLSRIRRALATATDGAIGNLVLIEHGRYRLDPDLVKVDYWRFATAVTRRRTATAPVDRTHSCEMVVAGYGGTLADGLDSEWLVSAREATRRDALDAVAALARARVADDPDYTLDLLETARAFDPHNELLYRDIMRLQHTLGRHDAISRTLSLLETRLTEVDTAPTADTIDLARRLRDHAQGLPLTDTTEPPHCA